jgi:hypothetical protein
MNLEVKSVNKDWGQDSTSVIDSNHLGKIKLTEQPTFSSHRSGWAYAISSIASLHNQNGVEFYGFLENEFAWRNGESLDNGTIPITKDWVGFLHNPQKAPWWFGPKTHPLSYMSSYEFRKSLEKCKGLFCLSHYHAEFIKSLTGVKVEVLKHPSETPDKQFNFDSFLENRNRRLFTIGYWLRKVNSIYALPTKNNLYIKTRVLPYKKNSSSLDFVNQLRQHEFNYESESIKEISRWFDSSRGDVEELNALPNDEYDDLFVNNIVYLDLYDSSANNAVIESIARATPILVNPIPAVVEYLGVDYPFYFNSFDEAVEKMNDFNLILATHEYLKYCESKLHISGEYFFNRFKESEIYKNL